MCFSPTLLKDDLAKDSKSRLQSYDIKMVLGRSGRRSDLNTDWKSSLSQIFPSLSFSLMLGIPL